MFQFHAAGPDLTLVYATNCLAQAFQTFLFGEDSLGAGAETFEYVLRTRRIQQQDTLNLTPERAQFAQHLGSPAGLVVPAVADHRNTDGDARHSRKQLLLTRSLRDDAP